MTPGSSVEAAELSCGTADDVALALAGLRPDESWITRELLFLGVNTDDYAVTFAAGPFVMPVLHADGVLADFCPDEGTGGTGGSGATAPSSGGGCDSSAGGDGAEGAADGCDGAAEGLGDIGDIDCAAPRIRPRRSALWTLAFALLAAIGRLRRSRRNG